MPMTHHDLVHNETGRTPCPLQNVAVPPALQEVVRPRRVLQHPNAVVDT